MKRLFSTEALHPRDRFDCFHDVACRQIIDHEGRPTAPRLEFRACLDVAEIADLSMVRLETSAFDVDHLERHVPHAADQYFFVRHQGGGFALDQTGRRLSLQPGEMTLLDPRQPYTAQLTGYAQVMVLKVPRRELLARLGDPSELIARPLRPVIAENALASGFLGSLPPHTESLGSSASFISNQTLDLMALALARTAGTQPRLGCTRAVLAMQLRSSVEKNLTDPHTTPKVIAASVGISVRYANSILAQQNTSLGRLILTRRLERCREALADPAQMKRTIASIAFAWGFLDLTHFGRRFREAFGLLPSEFRLTRTAGLPCAVGRDSDAT